jgi:uncharacterized protein (DUF4415 family)
MNKKMVRYTLETLPPLTDAQRANLRALSARPDSEIDTRDIPVLTDAEWAKTERVRGHLYRPVKRIVTARLDGDVLEWLKSSGRGYQSRMNAILRREMLLSFNPAANKSPFADEAQGRERGKMALSQAAKSTGDNGCERKVKTR